MSQEEKKLIHIQPVVRNWELFTKGAKSAGYEFTFAADDDASLSLISMKHHYRNSVPVALPDFFLRLIGNGPAFILRSEELTLLYQAEIPGKGIARLYSRKYTRPKLRLLGGRILCQLAQQYAYLYLVHLLDAKDYMIVSEAIDPDLSIQITLRRWKLKDQATEDITILSGPQKEEIILEINPQGIITMDLTSLESPRCESYAQWLSNHLGYSIGGLSVKLTTPPLRKDPAVTSQVTG